MAEMCRLSLMKDWEAAEAINRKLSILNDVLFLESNPIPVKWALLQQKKIGEGIRLPLTTLSAKYRAEVLQALQGFLL